MWRVEQSESLDRPDQGPHVYRPQDRYGHFYDEDAYIVLHVRISAICSPLKADSVLI